MGTVLRQAYTHFERNVGERWFPSRMYPFLSDFPAMALSNILRVVGIRPVISLFTISRD